MGRFIDDPMEEREADMYAPIDSFRPVPEYHGRDLGSETALRLIRSTRAQLVTDKKTA